MKMANLPLPSFRKGGILEIFFRVILIQTEEGGVHMKCYVCAKQGVDEEAVAICIICGMGLCLGHAFKEELLVRDVIDWGLERKKLPIPGRFLVSSVRNANWLWNRGRRDPKSD